MPYRYGGYSDPADYYQGTPFDPFTGRLQGGQMVMSVLNQIAANKRRKKEEEFELEDRDLRKRLTEAQISNYMEVPAQKEPAKKGYALPPGVRKQVAQYHGLKDETEYDAYDLQMQQKMFEEFLEDQGEAKRFGLKGTPNKQAMARVKSINDIIKTLDSRAVDLRGQVNSMTMQPMSDPSGAGRESVNKALQNIRRIQWRLARMAREVDDKGNLPQQYEEELAMYLNSPSGVETGDIFKPKNTVSEVTEVPPRAGKFVGEEATSPKGQVFVWDGKKWAKK